LAQSNHKSCSGRNTVDFDTASSVRSPNQRYHATTTALGWGQLRSERPERFHPILPTTTTAKQTNNCRSNPSWWLASEVTSS
jgi:hypothetical protein